MRNKQILIILSSFDESEWRACHKYIIFCNKQQTKILDLFEYLFKYRKQLDSPKLQLRKVQNKIAPKASDKAFLNIMADLVRDVEYFLIHQELLSKNRGYDRTKILADIYKSKGLYDRFRTKTKQLKLEIEKLPPIDLFEDLRYLELYHSTYFSEAGQKYSGEVGSLGLAKNAIESLYQKLTTFYHIEETNNRKLFKIASKTKTTNQLNKTTDLLDHILALVKTPNNKSYQKLRSKLANDLNHMSKELSEALLIYLINYCLNEFKSGRSSVDELAFLYNLGLSKGILLHGGKLSDNRFLTIIEIVSKSKDYNSPDDFIQKWLVEVESKEIQSVENMAYAHWHFSKKEYRSALEKINLSETRVVNINLSIRARWIKVCSLYSQYPSYDNSNEIISSAKIFLKRHENEIGQVTYEGSLNLFELVNMMWNNEEQKELVKFVKNSKYPIFRTWANETLQSFNPK